MNKFLTLAMLAALDLTVALSPSLAENIPLSEISHIHGIGFDATEPGSILLATHFGIYRARPDGTASTVSLDASDYMGFSPDPSDAGRLLASGHPGQGGNMGVIASTDGGVTWQKLSDGVNGPVDFHAMTISRADPGVIYGLYDGIQVSRDGGATWEIAGPGPDKVIDLAVSPANPDLVYAGTAGGLMQSSDAGRNWTLIGPKDVPVSVIEAMGDGSVYAFFVGMGLFELSATNEWTTVASDFGGGYLLHLAADPADPAHLVAVNDEGSIVASTDGGKNWAAFAK